MAKPLISEAQSQAKSVQFAHFGLLNDGAQSKTSMLTSVTINVLIALVIIIVGAATKKVADDSRHLATLVDPPPIEKPPPVVERPKIIPPKPKVIIPPKIAIVEPPKIRIPEIKVPEPPKPTQVKMETPKPAVPVPVPARVFAPPAPVAVKLPTAPASVVNNDPHPTAVRLGNPDSPVKSMTGPAVSKVNLAAGANGMPPQNTGGGPAAAKVNLGGGQPTGTAMKGPMGPVAVTGLAKATPANGPTTKGPAQVALGAPVPVIIPRAVVANTGAKSSGPKVLYKPKPVYTAEAVQMHLEGTVSIRIRVTTSGTVEVLGVTNGLGHGLDESAVRAIQATKFQPALDASGTPVVWEGVVSVNFQLAG